MRFLASALSALAAASALAGPASPTAERIERLSDPDFDAREKALKELLDDPAADAPLIRKAWEKESDMEVRSRLGRVLAERLRPALRVEVLFRDPSVDVVLLGRAVLTAPTGYPDPAAEEAFVKLSALGWPAPGDCYLPPDAKRKKGQRLTLMEKLIVREMEPPPLEDFLLLVEDAPDGKGATLRVMSPPFAGTFPVPPPGGAPVWFARGKALFRIERMHPEAALALPPVVIRYLPWRDRVEALRAEAEAAAAGKRIDGLQDGDLPWILDGKAPEK